MVQALSILCSALTVVLVLLGLFAYQSFLHGMPKTEALQKKGSSRVLNMWMLEFAYWLLRPLVRGLVWCRIHPNTISWASVFFSGFGAIALVKGYFGYGAVLSMVAFLLDAVDGMVARMANMISDAGAVLDSTLDRYTEFFFFMGLLLYYRFEPLAQALIAAALCGSWMVSYSSAKAESMQVKIPRGTMRRPERLVILVLGATLAPILTPLFEPDAVFPMHFSVLVSVAWVAIFSNYTAIYRTYHLYRRLAGRANRDSLFSFPFHQKPARQRLIRAIVASLIPTVIDVGVLVFLVEVASFHYVVATAIGVCCGTIVAYLLRRHWFYSQSQVGSASQEEREFLQDLVISSTNVLWNVMLVYGIAEWIEVPYLGARLVAALSVALVWNWPLNSRFVFPNSEHHSVSGAGGTPTPA